MDNPQELRELAEWYRGWAIVGNDEERPARLQFADYLARRAKEAEAEQAHRP